MRKIFLIAAATLCLSSGAFADDDFYRTTQNLTPAQRAELVLQAEKMTNAAKANTPEAAKAEVNRFREYAELGQALGAGLVGTAKELGVAVNEFSQSPVGKFTMFLIGWKFFGHQILHVGLGLLYFCTFIPLWLYMYRRYCILEKITIEGSRFHANYKKVVEYQDTHGNGDKIAGMVVLLFVTVAVGIAITFAG